MLYIYYSNQLWLSGHRHLVCWFQSYYGHLMLYTCCALEQGTKSALWLVQLKLGTDLHWAGAPEGTNSPYLPSIVQIRL